MNKLLFCLGLILLIGFTHGRNIVKREEAAQATEESSEQPVEAAATEEQNTVATADTNSQAQEQVTIDEKFIEQALEAHNQIREMHGVPRLVHNAQLSQLAQAHADNLAKHRLLVNSAKIFNNQAIGENLLYIQDSDSNKLTGDRATIEWYSRYPEFDYTKDFQQEGATLSQIIWRDTKEVGFGVSRTENGGAYIVADYYPAGNVLGYYADNVFPAKQTETTDQKQ